METPELILFEGLVAKSRIGEMRFGEGLYLRPAGRLSDSASVGAARVKMVSFGIKGKMQRNMVNGKGGDILAFEKGSILRIEFQNIFLWRITWQFLWTQRSCRLVKCKGGKMMWMEIEGEERRKDWLQR